jgi:1-deoxy-D-xylulose-5-phosphate reductoisomerase
MKGAIAYALSHPERLPLEQPIPDFAGIGMLKFKRLNLKKFPCLSLAFSAGRQGGTLPAVLNAANEAAVHAFLERQISFVQIAAVIEKTMSQHAMVTNPSLDDIIASDEWARRQAEIYIQKMHG